MQPLNTTPRPSSLSTMGCWEEGAGSRTLRRRCPNAIDPCAKKPAASGPRDCIDSVALESSTSETSPLVLTSPQNPHMPVFRAPLPFVRRGLQPSAIAQVPVFFEERLIPVEEQSRLMSKRARQAHGSAALPSNRALCQTALTPQ